VRKDAPFKLAAMNVFQTRDKSPQSKPYQNLASIGLALVLCALTALTPVSTQAAQAADPKQAKRPSTASAKPAKAKPQQRKKNAVPKKQATRPVRLAAVTGTALASSAQTQAWVQDAAQRLQLDPIWVQNTLAQAQRLPSVERLILPPSSPAAKNWAAYRARFIEPIRIQAGARFWQTHRAALERAEREYGVPASVIVGIIGVETLYGQYTGQSNDYFLLAKVKAFAFRSSKASSLSKIASEMVCVSAFFNDKCLRMLLAVNLRSCFSSIRTRNFSA
jgi:membrane-bound lytic murein transglycosylase B